MSSLQNGQTEEPSRIMQAAFVMPMLSSEDEQLLARKWRDEGDIKARNKIITSHLRMAAKAARGYAGYGLSVKDLMSEASRGLTEAMNTFNPDLGFRFATHAIHHITSAMKEYVLHSVTPTKLGTTSDQKKMFFNLPRIKAGLNESGPISEDGAKFASERLGIAIEKVKEMDSRMVASHVSLDSPIARAFDGDMERTRDGDIIFASPLPSPESELIEHDLSDRRGQMLQDALNILNKRERDIVVARQLQESNEIPTLEVLARKYGVSRERIRQIEHGALTKMTKAMREAEKTGHQISSIKRGNKNRPKSDNFSLLKPQSDKQRNSVNINNHSPTSSTHLSWNEEKIKFPEVISYNHLLNSKS
jgi:RNA polymerase sigma-32 factor